MHQDSGGETAGLSRRDMLKRSVVVGGLAWVAPTVLSSPVGASAVSCPAGQRYAIKHNNGPHGAASCEVPGTNPSPGNCTASSGITQFQSGCCLEPGLISFASSGAGQTHTYTLAAGVGFYAGFAKCGADCHSGSPYVTVSVHAGTGVTTVVMSCPSLSHSELVVCLSGSNLPVCR